MEKAESEGVETKKVVEPTPAETTLPTNEATNPAQGEGSPSKKKCKKYKDNREKKPEPSKSKKKSKKTADADSSSSDDSSSSSDESEEDDSESESESSGPESAKLKKKAKKAKAAARKAKAKQLKKKGGKKKRAVTEDESTEVEDSSEDEKAASKSAKALAKALAKKQLKQLQQGEADEDVEIMDDDPYARNRGSARHPQLQRFAFGNPGAPRRRIALNQDPGYIMPARQRNYLVDERTGLPVKQKVVPKKNKRASKVAYKRVDQLWDQSIHNYKLTETIDDPDTNEWDQYIFTIRRRFDWEHKYLETLVDIKSKPLIDCLQHVMADVKGVSLAQDTPHIDPNMLFLFLEEFRAYQKKLAEESESAKKKKLRKAAGYKAQHLKILIKYLDKDYAEIKKTLNGLLSEKTITFDLLWALYKPNSIAYCSTYNDPDHPRAFKMEYCVKESHFMKGSWYSIEGKYLEYDGKSFGMGTMSTEVASFQGARKISSLDCYPLQYHRDPEGMKTKLIERGKKFVALKGMNYRCHKGMAFTKRKRQVLKININGRVMIDPAIHRRINPNYPISTVKPKDDQDIIDIDARSDDESCGCDQSSSSDGELGDRITPSSSEDGPEEHRKKHRIIKGEDGQYRVVEIDFDEEGRAIIPKEKLGIRKGGEETFSDEELLIASPVVLGFAFSEKLWLEFTVSGISDVQWNEGAFDSLVLPDNQKSIVKALVSSHAFHPSQNIDDIISSKGLGLVAVLHGPPGTGKTLTAEGIADLLKCPLYMVSAGDLGTDPRTLEKELQNILDIAHSWGALLLLDEADVFLEKRSIHDIHRNALVSIFLRLLEYFQGILFLTTNRVETFDEAFVSRIHLSLRYGELNTKAKKTVWKMFIDKVKKLEGIEVENITESDLNDLAKRNLNGRQIKNLTRAAQALAVHEGKALSMEHIKRVIDVAETFEMDLKGGTGYMDAMRGYT